MYSQLCGGLLGSCTGGLICVLGVCVLQSGSTCGVSVTCSSGLVCVGELPQLLEGLGYCFEGAATRSVMFA